MDRVVIAFSKDETADKLKRMLDGTEYEVYAVCHSHSELIRCISDVDDILVIMGYKIGGFIADDIAQELSPGQKLMSIVKVENRDMLCNESIYVLSLPVNKQKLISSIEIFTGVVERRSGSNRDPEEKIIIDKAKLYLMERYNMTEYQAHRFIQKRSMDKGARFVDTARKILHI